MNDEVSSKWIESLGLILRSLYWSV